MNPPKDSVTANVSVRRFYCCSAANRKREHTGHIGSRRKSASSLRHMCQVTSRSDSRSSAELLVLSLQVHDGSLTILGITRDDRGAYTCRAFSDQGEVLHTTRLLVQGTAIFPAPQCECTLCQTSPRPHVHVFKAMGVRYLSSEAAEQVSGVLMYGTYPLSLYLSVNSSVWGLALCTHSGVHVCVCAGSLCENVTVCLRSINQAFC